MAPQHLVIDRDVMVPVRDGVRLATDVFRPAGDGPHPALLLRTPYGKQNRATWGPALFEFDDAVERGYAVAVQDCRGTTASEGRFAPILQERDDGHDTIRWVADQPWCDGRVGVWGMSYMGVTALQACVDAPPALRAAVAYVTAGDHTTSWGRTGGAFELGFNLRWMLDQAAAQLARPGAVDEALAAAVRDEIDRFWADHQGFYRASLDPAALAPAAASTVPIYRQLLDHDATAMARVDTAAQAERFTAPVLAIAGWQDGMLRSLLRLHAALVARGPAGLRDHHRLIVGPWDHGAYLSPMTGAMAGVRHFGRGAAGGRAGLKDRALGFLDRWLRDGGEDGGDGAAASPPVRYFAMGPDRWVDADAWPPPAGAEPERWYLWSGGRANSRHGDGRLDPVPPPAQPADGFVDDPADPVPTTGGRALLYPFIPAGFQDQAEVEERDDVLVYTSAPLVEPVSVEGTITLELFVRTSAPTTDLCATLADVGASASASAGAGSGAGSGAGGRSLSVADGITRLGLGTPGGVRPVTVDLGDTSYRFDAGHRIRLLVASSSFPRFDRNRNVGPGADPAAGRPAVQQLLHDPAHPAALVLPRPITPI
jgi:hypothetical protein